MDSPISTHSDGGDNGRLTPKPTRKFYWPKMNESRSPLMCGVVDTEEFGWGDSPEPLDLNLYIPPPKKVEASVETPVSHRKHRTARPRRQIASTVSADDELKMLKDLTRHILCESSSSTDSSKVASPVVRDPALLPPSTDSIAQVGDRKNDLTSVKKPMECTSSCLGNDPEVVSFYSDDDFDICLSQVDVLPDVESSLSSTSLRGKGSFVKSLSDNQLESPSRGSLRRTSSFQPITSTSSAINTDAAGGKTRVSAIQPSAVRPTVSCAGSARLPFSVTSSFQSTKAGELARLSSNVSSTYQPTNVGVSSSFQTTGASCKADITRVSSSSAFRPIERSGNTTFSSNPPSTAANNRSVNSSNPTSNHVKRALNLSEPPPCQINAPSQLSKSSNFSNDKILSEMNNVVSNKPLEETPQPLKKQKSFHVDKPGGAQYTVEQIEQKRLQAIYRQKFKEIERKKMEAQRRLNERRARLATESTNLP